MQQTAAHIQDDVLGSWKTNSFPELGSLDQAAKLSLVSRRSPFDHKYVHCDKQEDPWETSDVPACQRRSRKREQRQDLVRAEGLAETSELARKSATQFLYLNCKDGKHQTTIQETIQVDNETYGPNHQYPCKYKKTQACLHSSLWKRQQAALRSLGANCLLLIIMLSTVIII